MATLSKDKLGIVKKLYYEKELSVRAMAEELGVSMDSIYYFMRKYNLPRRSVSENEVIKFRNKPKSFSIKEFLNKRDGELMLAGTLLYWAEGYKTKKAGGVDFANSDPHMVEAFVRFLREICGVEHRRLRVLLYCYSDQDVSDLIAFWSKLTKIPKSQFSKPYIKKYPLTGNKKMIYGMVHIRYADKKLLAQILEWIKSFKREYCVGGRVVNYTSL